MSHRMTRRAVLGQLAGAAAGTLAWSARPAAQSGTPIVVYKDANCGCCQKWVDHMAANGFAPTVHDTADMRLIKTKYRVGDRLQSCHTTVVGPYVIEGHVPAADVRRLLTEKPTNIIGLTIPGMPASAPGMDLTPFQPYTVLTFDGAGRTAVFTAHNRP